MYGIHAASQRYSGDQWCDESPPRMYWERSAIRSNQNLGAPTKSRMFRVVDEKLLVD